MMLGRGGLVLLLLILCTFPSLLFAYPASICFQRALNVFAWLLFCALRSPRDPSRRPDLLLFIIILITRWLPSSIEFLGLHRGYQFSLPAIGIITLAAVLAAYQFWRGSRPQVGISFSNDQDHGPDFPRVHPCRTTHTRMFPRKHAFSYSYLQVSVPVDFEGSWGLVSVGSASKRSWFHLQASDYLERGSSTPSLKVKLNAYLDSQGVRSSEWHKAYLVTAPRFLGYSFNPVSFWYIYNEDQVLTMMILEVNNTFDERRMYLLKSTEEQKSDDALAANEKQLKSRRFKNAWAKDFHVSPFNSREGHYQLSAADLLKDEHIDNTIVLKSSKDHVKLIARIFSEGPGFDPNQLSRFDKGVFLLNWFWVGFATFPRILKEAAALFLRRNLHVWFRPEVLPTSIGRNPTSAEIELESFFVRYLEDVVKRCSTNIQVTYTSGLPDGQPRIFRSSGLSPATPPDTLQIKVLTPAFFSRFVNYVHTSEAFDRECIFTDEKNRTIWISQPALLPNLFAAGAGASQQRPLQHGNGSWKWKLVQRLRCPPATPSYPYASQTADGQDIRAMNLSPLDTFVRRQCDDFGLYQRLCLRLFLGQRFACGYPEIVDTVDLILRGTLIWFGVSAIVRSLLPSDLEESAALLDIWLASLSGLGRQSLVHLWASLKE